MLDEKIFGAGNKYYMSDIHFTYEKSAIVNYVSTDIFDHKGGRAFLKENFEFIGYCDPRKLKFRPSDELYVMMVHNKEDVFDFWLHVNENNFFDILDNMNK